MKQAGGQTAMPPAQAMRAVWTVDAALATHGWDPQACAAHPLMAPHGPSIGSCRLALMV